MAIAITAHTIAGSTTGNNVTTSGIDTTGASLLIAGVATFGGGLTPTDSKGHTWSNLTLRAGSGSQDAQLWYVANPTVGSGHTFSLTSTSKTPTIAVIALSGAKLISPFDVENGATNSSGTIQTGSITPSEDNEILIAFWSGYTGSASSIDSGFTILDSLSTIGSQRMGAALAYLIQTTAAAKNPTWTLSGTLSNAAAIGSWKAAAGATKKIPWPLFGRVA